MSQSVPWVYTVRKGVEATAYHEVSGPRTVKMDEVTTFKTDEYQGLTVNGVFNIFTLARQWPNQGWLTLEVKKTDVGRLFYSHSSSGTKTWETLAMPNTSGVGKNEWTWTCNCPAWLFQKNGRKDCKHIVNWKANGGI